MYNPNEPRDNTGKWTDAGMSSAIKDKLAPGLKEESLTQRERYILEKYGVDGAVYNKDIREAIPDFPILPETEEFIKNMDSALNKLPLYEAKSSSLWRGLSFRDGIEFETAVKQFEPGKIFIDKAYMSTSANSADAEVFTSQPFALGQPIKNAGILIQIEGAKSGRDIHSRTGGYDESEIVFPRESKWLVLDKRYNKKRDRYNVTMKEL